MIKPDFSIEYPFIKLPFDYSLQGFKFFLEIFYEVFKNSKKNVEK